MKRLVALLIFAASSWATAGPVDVVYGMEAHFGDQGDTLAIIQYTDGTEQELKAGQGLVFYGGLRAELPLTGMALQGTLGWKYSSSMASNIDVSKTAFPMEITGIYTLPGGAYFAGGLTSHFNPQLKLDDTTIEYEASTGFHLKGGWKWFSLGLTSITYEYAPTGAEFDASSVSVAVQFPI